MLSNGGGSDFPDELFLSVSSKSISRFEYKLVLFEGLKYIRIFVFPISTFLMNLSIKSCLFSGMDKSRVVKENKKSSHSSIVKFFCFLLFIFAILIRSFSNLIFQI